MRRDAITPMIDRILKGAGPVGLRREWFRTTSSQDGFVPVTQRQSCVSAWASMDICNARLDFKFCPYILRPHRAGAAAGPWSPS